MNDLLHCSAHMCQWQNKSKGTANLKSVFPDMHSFLSHKRNVLNVVHVLQAWWRR